MPNLKSRLAALSFQAGAVTAAEKCLLLVVFAVFAVALVQFQRVNIWAHNMDTTFLLEAIESARTTGTPTTATGASFFDAYETFLYEPSRLCMAALAATKPAMNVLTNHAYYAIYSLAALTYLIPSHEVAAIANGLAFSSFILVLYSVLRRQMIAPLAALAFCALAMAHPAWSFAQMGDLYLDRFFMPLGLLYMALLYRVLSEPEQPERLRLTLIFLVGAVTATLTERAAIMLAFVTLLSVMLYFRQISRNVATALIVFSLLLLLGVWVWIRLVYVQHSATPNQVYFIKRAFEVFVLMKEPVFAAQVWEFLGINLALFGLFALADWRLALLAAAALVPNLLVTMGGAEKNGWATHYHSLYFPFLTYAAAVGFGKLWTHLGGAGRRLGLTAAVMLLVPCLSHASPAYGSQAGAMTRVVNFYRMGKQSNERHRAGVLQRVADTVPPGSRVTTPEGFMPVLYRGRSLTYYPIGLDSVDYAVLTRVASDGGATYFSGAISYAGKAREMDACLTERLKAAGYDTDHPVVVLDDVAVLKRNPE